MKNNYLLIVIALFLILISNSLFAQAELGVVGKIYTKADADKLYGKVLESKIISTKAIVEAIEKVDYYIMFKIIDGKVAIADRFRTSISPELVTISSDEVMHIYSKTKVAEVLNKGGEPTTTIEKRADVLTITNGMYTLEMAILCPPVCL